MKDEHKRMLFFGLFLFVYAMLAFINRSMKDHIADQEWADAIICCQGSAICAGFLFFLCAYIYILGLTKRNKELESKSNTKNPPE